MERVLNVTSGSDDLRARELSNFQIRPFTLDGVCLCSPEGFIQGTKFPPQDPRREQAFQAAGSKAKRLGQEAENRFVWWNGEQIEYGSRDHRALIERAIRASFEQNPMAMAILRSTRGMTLLHDTGTPEGPRTSLPATVFCDILTRIRDENWVPSDWGRAFLPERGGSTLSLEEMQAAAKLIETDGDEGFRTTERRFGRDVALLLLVAHLRRAHGSMDSFPSDPGIDESVQRALREVTFVDH